jgi:hypothetical protein
MSALYYAFDKVVAQNPRNHLSGVVMRLQFLTLSVLAYSLLAMACICYAELAIP